MCSALMAEQYGVVGREQLIAAGLSPRAVDRRLESGQYKMLLPGIYAHVAAPASSDQSLLAACIWSTGHASHRSAAGKWRLAGFDAGGPIEVATSRPMKHSEITVHRRSPLPACDLTSIDGIPITSAHRTLLDLGAVVREAALEVALDDALRRGLTTLPQLRWHIGAAGGRGVRGTAALRRILEARAEDKGVCHSPLETIFRRLFRKSSLPTPEKQYNVIDGDRFLARVDFAYPGHRIAIEVSGWKWHAGKRRWERDLRRRTLLESFGWMVLEFTWDEVVHHPMQVIATIGRALEERSLLLGRRFSSLQEKRTRFAGGFAPGSRSRTAPLS
jgi:Protein of unknown function (DUF559)/Transcriptional regulator, AbiEi antitoxin